ncbi:MAG: hypothetical protein HYX59_07760 [Elusimicrobia bacterium]|nr:hypothetical protein [Elusimicrobiota bacterium]
MTRRRFPVALALGALALAGLAASFYLGVAGEDRFDPIVRLMMVSLPIPLAAGLFMVLVSLYLDDGFRELVAERAAAAPGLGLADAGRTLPAAVAAARAFKRGNAPRTGRPLSGAWEGGELFFVERAYYPDTDNDYAQRRYTLVFAFQVPETAAGVVPPPPWKVQPVDGWLVLSRSDPQAVETARLGEILAEARGFARETLQP